MMFFSCSPASAQAKQIAVVRDASQAHKVPIEINMEAEMPGCCIAVHCYIHAGTGTTSTSTSSLIYKLFHPPQENPIPEQLQSSSFWNMYSYAYMACIPANVLHNYSLHISHKRTKLLPCRI